MIISSIKQQLSYSYFATYQHMGPYCLGLFVGYILHKRPTIRLPTHLTWLLWLLLPPLSFTTLLLTYLWNGAYKEPSMINPSPLISAFYIAIHRIIWTSLTAWIVFACVTNRAKLLAKFLSHHYFVPISRLSFSIYLVHMPLIMYRALNMRHTKEWTDGNILWEACGNFVTSCLLGYFLNVCFESPFINLEQALFRRSNNQRQQIKQQANANDANSRRRLSNESSESFTNLNTSTSEVTDSSANNSPEFAKREPNSLLRLTQAIEFNGNGGKLQTGELVAPPSDGNSMHEAEAKQLKRLVDEELFSIANDFKQRPKLMRSKSTLGNRERPANVRDNATVASDDTAAEDEEIYQLGSENYHQSPYSDGQSSAMAKQTTNNRIQMFAPNINSERPAHYATLARISRFSQQEMSTILSNRPGGLSLNTHANMDCGRGQQHLHQTNINRRKPRYNTLTSARDWAQQQQQSTFNYNEANSQFRSSFNNSQHRQQDNHVRVPSVIDRWQLETNNDANEWEQQTFNQQLTPALGHYIIPRIELSTLRRPMAANMHQMSSRLHANHLTRNSMPIVEEPANCINEDDDNQNNHDLEHR